MATETKKLKPQQEKKRAKVDEIAKKIKDTPVTILTDYRGNQAGLNIKQLDKLRSKLAEKETEYKILKNSLTALAVKKLKLDEMLEHLEGPTAIVFGKDDPSAIAKIIVDFTKDKITSVNPEGLPRIKIGYIDGQIMDSTGIRRLASLPSKSVLYSQVIAGVQSPLYGLVNVINGTMNKLVWCLEAIKKKKEQSS